jgi:hypothetical protein
MGRGWHRFTTKSPLVPVRRPKGTGRRSGDRCSGPVRLQQLVGALGSLRSRYSSAARIFRRGAGEGYRVTPEQTRVSCPDKPKTGATARRGNTGTGLGAAVAVYVMRRGMPIFVVTDGKP